MKKFFVSNLLVSLLLCVMTIQVIAAGINVQVNGKKVEFESKPVQINGVTLVPMREIFNSLSATVSWNSKLQTVKAAKGNQQISIKLNSKQATINGKPYSLDVPAKMINQKIFVPLRFVGQAFGAKVSYDTKNSRIEIKTGEIKTKKSIEQVAKNNKSVLLVEKIDVTGEVYSTGSAFVINKQGIVVTNYHVIEGASDLTFKDSNQRTYQVQSVLNYDKKKDIAILRVSGLNTLPALRLSDSSKAAIGQEVIAIGSPLGLQNTVSNGLISGIRTFLNQKQIQISAPITGGSSGGALFNMYGEVLGVTTSGIEGGGNLNFAVPINSVKKLMSKYSPTSLKSFVQREKTLQLPFGMYYGPVVYGEPKGNGRIEYDDGDEYVGYVSNGLNGEGTMYYSDGARFAGEWLAGDYHGIGTLTFKSGNSLTARYMYGELSGPVLYTFTDGGQYFGDYRDDMFHGYGKYTWADGEVYEGEFVNDEMTGLGKLTYTDGSEFLGMWKDGVKEGFGTMTFSDGAKLSINYVNGKEHGWGTYTKWGNTVDVQYSYGLLMQ